MINEASTPDGQQFAPKEVIKQEADLRETVAKIRQRIQEIEATKGACLPADFRSNLHQVGRTSVDDFLLPFYGYDFEVDGALRDDPNKLGLLNFTKMDEAEAEELRSGEVDVTQRRIDPKKLLSALLHNLEILATYYNHEEGDGKPLELGIESHRRDVKEATDEIGKIRMGLEKYIEDNPVGDDPDKEKAMQANIKATLSWIEFITKQFEANKPKFLKDTILHTDEQIRQKYGYPRIAELMVAQKKGFPTQLTEKREAELQAERERLRPEGTQQTMTDSLASQDKTQEAIQDDAHDYLVQTGLTDYEAALPKDLVRLMRDEGKELIEIPAETALRVSARVFRQIEVLTATLTQEPEFKPVDEKVLVEAFQTGTQMFQDSQGLNEFHTEKTGSYGGIIDPRVRGEYTIDLLQKKYNLSDVSTVPVIVAFAAGAGLLVGYSSLNYDLQNWMDGRVTAETAREVQQRIADSLQSDMAVEYKFTQRFAPPEVSASQNAPAPAIESPFAIRAPTQENTSPAGETEPVADATQNQSSGAAFNPFAVRNTS